MIDIKKEYAINNALNRYKQLLNKEEKYEIIKEVANISDLEATDLRDVKGIGEKTVQKLIESGIKNQAQLKEKSIEEIMLIGLNHLTLQSIKNFLESNTD